MTNRIEIGIHGYSQWRLDLYERIERLRCWLEQQHLYTLQSEARIRKILNALRDDKLYIAFVAEFSRGKSELINALLYTGLGKRLLPSSAGRTTMCPTEILYRPNTPHGLSLLPIETRTSGSTIEEYRNLPDQWKQLTFDMTRPEEVADVMGALTQTRRVPVDYAEKLGLTVSSDETHEAGFSLDENGMVEIPRWRHAIVNIDHPLLRQGLVILDTPGLNALGAEPELTLKLLAGAHATLFILAADTGVTRSDVMVWRDHIRQNTRSEKASLVVLNKIDGLWDELRSAQQIEQEVARQVNETADILAVPKANIFPVSAQKGLLGKVREDGNLLARSRIEALEDALSNRLIPCKQEIVRGKIRNNIADLADAIQATLQERVYSIEEHIQELESLTGKNNTVIDDMLVKVKRDKSYFEASLQRFSKVRSTFARLSNKLYSQMSLKAADRLIAETKKDMSISITSAGMGKSMQHFFQEARGRLEEAGVRSSAIKLLMDDTYKEFHQDYGLTKLRPRGFSTARYLDEIDKLRASHENLMQGMSMLLSEQMSLVKRFRETVMARVREIYERANSDADNWLRTLMSPMESQIREYQSMLQRRLESIKRINVSTDTLDLRLLELRQSHSAVITTVAQLESMVEDIDQILRSPPANQ